jgi:hypothetical protein
MPCGLVILQQRKDHKKIAKMLTDKKPVERERKETNSKMAYLLHLDPDLTERNRRRVTLRTPIESLHAQVTTAQNWMRRWRIVVHPMIAAGIATLRICFAISPR